MPVLILLCRHVLWWGDKTIGANYWRGLSKSTYYILKVMLFITYPVVIISIKITKLFSKDKNNNVTREELSALSNQAYSEGIFSMQENRIIQNIIFRDPMCLKYFPDFNTIPILPKCSTIILPRIWGPMSDQKMYAYPIRVM